MTEELDDEVSRWIQSTAAGCRSDLPLCGQCGEQHDSRLLCGNGRGPNFLGWVDIPVTRNESGFDRACDAAYQIALAHFEIDGYGHSIRVRDGDRTSCWIEVSFLRYTRIGNEHHYEFRATAARPNA